MNIIILEKLFLCKIYCLSDIDNLYYNELPYYLNQRLSLYKKGLNQGCNIILNYNDSEILKILKKDYEFEDYKISNNFIKNYKIVKKINNKINIFKYTKYAILINLIIYLLNNIQKYITMNIGFEITKGNFIRIKNKIDDDLCSELKFLTIIKKYSYYLNRLKCISLDKPKKCLNIGVFSNEYVHNKLYYDYTLENILSNKNMICKKSFYHINKFKYKYYKYKINKYCKYITNINVVKNIYDILYNDYDGIIYITQDANLLDDVSMIIIENICKKEKISMINISFNEKISKMYIENNINMLYDLININNIDKIS